MFVVVMLLLVVLTPAEEVVVFPIPAPVTEAFPIGAILEADEDKFGPILPTEAAVVPLEAIAVAPITVPLLLLLSSKSV
jgi:hypothetical protein